MKTGVLAVVALAVLSLIVTSFFSKEMKITKNDTFTDEQIDYQIAVLEGR